MNNNQNYPLALHQPNSEYAIRVVNLSDIHELQSSLWRHKPLYVTERLIKRILKYEEQGRGLGIIVSDLLHDTNRLVGFGQITLWVKCAEISDLIVHPDYRGQGIGTSMIQYLTRHVCLQNIDCVELGVAESNPRALALYRRLGFEDSYTLQLDLGNGTEPVIYLRIDLTQYQ